MSFPPTSGRNSANPAAAVALSGALLLGTAAVPAAAVESRPAAPVQSQAEPQAVAGAPFKDVAWNNQFAKEIVWVAQSGISTGWPDGTYRPLEPVSREAMAAFMHRLDALKGVKDELPSSAPMFSDVAGTKFEGEIGWLAASGITTGWSDGTYRPYSPVNRDAMAAYLYRMAGYPAFTMPEKSQFADVGTVGPLSRPIAWLASTGISTGWENPDGTRTFRPLEPVARDAMAAFMYRFYEKGYAPKQ